MGRETRGGEEDARYGDTGSEAAQCLLSEEQTPTPGSDQSIKGLDLASWLCGGDRLLGTGLGQTVSLPC